MEITDYHAKLYAHELTRQCASDEVDKLAPVLADAKVDLNPHQVEAALFAFLPDNLTRVLIQELAERGPSRVVFLDWGYRSNDQIEANTAGMCASDGGESFKKFNTV